MKRCLLLLTLLFCAVYSFCQSNDSVSKVRDHYLRKSRAEQTTGIIALGVGTGLTTYAVVEGASTVLSFLKLKPKAPPKNLQAVAITGEVLFVGGAALLIAGSIHHNKATHLNFTMQKAEALFPAGRISTFCQPSLSLTFNFSNRKQKL